MRKNFLVFSLMLFLIAIFTFPEQAYYRLPPKDVIDIIDSPRLPVEFLSPDNKYLLVTKFDDLRSIEYLAEPFLKLAGMRIFPHNDSQASKPIQSYRMYHALRGHGTTARLVLLPRENHRYVARESILHVAAEMIEWFDRFVKKKGKENMN